MFSRWLGQLAALWDNAGQLVELRAEIERLDSNMEALRAELEKLNERTRKQDYRARKADEHAVFAPPVNGAVPVDAKSALRARAKALGVLQ